MLADDEHGTSADDEVPRLSRIRGRLWFEETPLRGAEPLTTPRKGVSHTGDHLVACRSAIGGLNDRMSPSSMRAGGSIDG
jgi:hypothetical protein